MFSRIAPLQHDTLEGIPDPSENPFLVGHERARRFVLNALSLKKLPHAMIFYGPRGIGKSTFAFHFSQHLAALSSNEVKTENFIELSPLSPIFRQVSQGVYPSLMYISRPPNVNSTGFSKVINVNEIRKLNQFLSLTPGREGGRVIILDPADDMNAAAANALLKNLEEPPPETFFILISHVRNRLLPAIVSRCQFLRFDPLSREELARALTNLLGQNWLDSANQDKLFYLSRGSVRKALIFHCYGGIPLLDTLHKLFSNKVINHREIYQMVETVSASDPEAFDAFNEIILDMFAEEARKAAFSGQKRKAKACAALWERARVETLQRKIYNLDKKQHAFIMLNLVSSIGQG